MMRVELSPSAQKSCEAKMWDNRERNHNAVADTPCGTTTSSASISIATKSKDYQTTALLLFASEERHKLANFLYVCSAAPQ